MTARLPNLATSHLPGISESEASATSSPSRGKQMAAFLRQKTGGRYPLNHVWDFWHDRQDRKPKSGRSDSPPDSSDGKTDPSAAYEDRLVKLHTVSDIKQFWELFNNFDVTTLPLRDSVHLFHHSVKPVWEDPRNVRGGSWTFRVPKEKAPQFWKEICIMAIGDELQKAVESDRTSSCSSSSQQGHDDLLTCDAAFRDDICGVSLSVRFTSTLVTIWNRDGEHEQGVKNILDTVLSGLSPELVPKESAYYYKKHSEHAGFTGIISAPSIPPTTMTEKENPMELMA